MYSMVLMAALTTGSDMPDCGRRCGGWGGGWGCCGCYGGYGWGGYGMGGYGWGGYGMGGGGYGMTGRGYGGWGASGGWGNRYGGSVYAPAASRYAAPALAANGALGDLGSVRSFYSDPNSTSDATRAKIIVHLPAKATLIVEGKRTLSTSSAREFVSPPLEPGKKYHYVFKAQWERDGETVTITQRVNVRPGQTEEVYLKSPDREQRVKATERSGQTARR